MTTFTTSRVFSATPEAVFAAFSTPQRLANWWGPDGFSNTIETFEFKPDGLWRFTMHGPDGTNYPNEARFITLEPPHTLVIQHLSQPHFQLSISLEPRGAATLVSWQQSFESAEIAASLQHIVEPANEQNLRRWQAEVARWPHAVG